MENLNKESCENPYDRQKNYVYRLKLEVYEDIYEPIDMFTKPSSHKFFVDALCDSDNKNMANEALRLNFENLLELFNAEVCGSKGDNEK
jgi:hypothetical protein